MGYRQVVIKKSDRISLKDNKLVVNKEGEDNLIPLEDINFIMLEDNRTVITTKLLSEIGEYSICLLICNDKHEPSTIMYPYNYHFKQLENINYQLELSDDSKHAIWQDIVKHKIANEIKVLEITTKEQEVIDNIYRFYNSIELGDVTNREGLAAKMYFRSLFGTDFIRFYEDALNKAMNYAYTVVRSSIVRTLATYGLNTYMGVNHKSKVNNFNLAYDLIEPYRALIDYYIYQMQNELTNPLTFDNRKKLVGVLNSLVICDGKRCSLEYSIDLLVKSYIKTISTGELHLSYPTIFYE